jgi:hypothetical protein
MGIESGKRIAARIIEMVESDKNVKDKVGAIEFIMSRSF